MRNLYLVARIWRLSLLFLLMHGKRLSQFIFLPIVVLSFLGVASGFGGGLLIVNLALHLVLYVMFAVAWHQYILTPSHNRTAWQYLKWDKDKWRYLAMSVMMTVLLVLVINITVRPTLWLIHSLNSLSLFFTHKPIVAELPPLQWGAVDIIALAVLLILCMPLSRLVMLLPAAALGEAFNFKRIWSISSGSIGFCFMLFLTLCLSQIIFGLGGVALRYVIAELLGSGVFGGEVGGLSVRLIDELIWQSFNYLTVAILITPLSLAFGILTEK